MNKKIMKGMLGLMALTALSINTSQAQTQPQDNLGGFTTKNTQKMDCDSTCIVPGSMDKSKVNIGVTSKDVGQFKWGPKCEPLLVQFCQVRQRPFSVTQGTQPAQSAPPRAMEKPSIHGPAPTPAAARFNAMLSNEK